MTRLLYSLLVLLAVHQSLRAQLVCPYNQLQAAEKLQQLKKLDPDTGKVGLLINLSQYYALRKKAPKIDLDSALLLAKLAEKLSDQLNYPVGKGKSCWASSVALREGKIHDRGETAAKDAINIFTNINDQQQLGDAYLEWSLYYQLSAKALTEKIRIMQMAELSFRKAGNFLKVADCLKELGDYHQIQGNFSQSLTDLKEALKISKSFNCDHMTGIYDLLGFVSTSLGDQQEGIRYGLLAVETAEKLQDTSAQLCTVYNRLGITYLNVNEYNKAGIYFQKSLSIAIRLHELPSIHELALNYANLLLQLNKPSTALSFFSGIIKKYPATDVSGRIRLTAGLVTIYETLNRYPEAKVYCDQLLEIEKETELNDEEQGLVYKAVIPFYLATNQHAEAKKYLGLNHLLADKTGSLMNLSANHLWWFKLDSSQSQYQSAIEHYEQYKTLNDSLFNQAKSRHINQLEILYNIEKKDQDIQLKEQNIQLLTKQGQLQQTRLEQANLLKNVTFGGVALLVIIVGLLFNRYRLKQQTNKKLESQQTEINAKNASLQRLVDEKEWLLKEIHHRIKNNLHMVVGLLNTQSGFLKSEEAKQAIAESQHRVNAMSMIHQKLYQSENLSATDMSAYINELVEYLRDSFNSGQRILFNLDIDRVQMDLTHSIPLGLILNEAITNSIKYAFPNGRDGIISIALKPGVAGNYTLTIADNGIGLPANFSKLNMTSLGMSLMEGLTEDMEGNFIVSGDNGTVITITFAYNPAAEPRMPFLLSENIPETPNYE